jgi:hypothetical protein
VAVATLAAGCGSGETRSASGVGPQDGRTPRIEVRAVSGLEKLAASVGPDPAVWTGLPGIPDSLLAGREVTVWFVRSPSTLDSLGLGPQERWVAGVADPSRRLVALRVAGAQRNLGPLRAVYRHEAAHVALYAATGGRAPRWMQEGYAQLASGEWDWREGWRLQFLLMRGGHAMLSDLDRRFRAGLDPRSSYVLAYTAVDALRRMGGEPGLRMLFERLRDGDGFDAALRRVYGITADQFERRWRDGVLDRYGWLYLLSRTAVVWLTLSVVIVALGIARVRRDRRRLAEMKERERREAAALEAALRRFYERSPPTADDVDGSPSVS